MTINSCSFYKASRDVPGMAPDRGEHPPERWLRPPDHRVEHRQGAGRQRHRLPRGHNILNVLQQVIRRQNNYNYST